MYILLAVGLSFAAPASNTARGDASSPLAVAVRMASSCLVQTITTTIGSLSFDDFPTKGVALSAKQKCTVQAAIDLLASIEAACGIPSAPCPAQGTMPFVHERLQDLLDNGCICAEAGSSNAPAGELVTHYRGKNNSIPVPIPGTSSTSVTSGAPSIHIWGPAFPGELADSDTSDTSYAVQCEGQPLSVDFGELVAFASKLAHELHHWQCHEATPPLKPGGDIDVCLMEGQSYQWEIGLLCAIASCADWGPGYTTAHQEEGRRAACRRINHAIDLWCATCVAAGATKPTLPTCLACDFLWVPIKTACQCAPSQPPPPAPQPPVPPPPGGGGDPKEQKVALHYSPVAVSGLIYLFRTTNELLLDLRSGDLFVYQVMDLGVSQPGFVGRDFYQVSDSLIIVSGWDGTTGEGVVIAVGYSLPLGRVVSVGEVHRSFALGVGESITGSPSSSSRAVVLDTLNNKLFELDLRAGDLSLLADATLSPGLTVATKVEAHRMLAGVEYSYILFGVAPITAGHPAESVNVVSCYNYSSPRWMLLDLDGDRIPDIGSN